MSGGYDTTTDVAGVPAVVFSCPVLIPAGTTSTD